MSITKVLADEKTPAKEKLIVVAETVAGAREAYGNGEATIAIPDVNTVNGVMPFNLLDDDSKVAQLASAVGGIKAQAVEYSRQNPGTNLNKKIEEILATNGMFCNIAPGTKFEYI